MNTENEYIKEEKTRLWIIPKNDLEAKAIAEMLERNGERYLVTGQKWGASWDGLEQEIKEQIAEAQREGKQVNGVELKGRPEGSNNIDHHIYDVKYNTGVPKLNSEGNQAKDREGNLLYVENRSNPDSSIEQVAKILGVYLTVDEMFIAANDKGYIPSMEKLGAKLGIEGADLQEVISNIRLRDREMQGITMEQEVQAQEAIDRLGEITEKKPYILIDRLPHSRSATITDKLYGKYDNLLITSQDGESNFYGTTEIINMLNERFPGGWSGGQLSQGSGFWGGYADQNAIKATVQKMIEKTKSVDMADKDTSDFIIE